jgi:hypothetical protein
MKAMTQTDFNNAILDKMRGGSIRTCEIIDAAWGVRTYLDLQYGRVKAARMLNSWLNEFLIEEYQGACNQRYGHWRLRALKEAEPSSGIFK